MTNHKSKIINLKFYTVLLLLLCFNPTLTGAQTETPPGPEMVLELAWDGLVNTPNWTELRVSLRNEGRDWAGELRISDVGNQIVYHQPLELPAHSHKSYRIPLFATASMVNLKATLRDTQEQDLHQQTLRIRHNETTTVCAIASPHDIGSGKSLAICDKKLLLSDLNSLPETAMAWDRLDFLFLNGASTADLNPPQQQALLAWVTHGGHLILSGGPALAQSLSGIPNELHIATPAAMQNFTGLATDIVASGTTAAPQLTLTADTRPFATLTADANLTAHRSIGHGTVTFLSWDIVQAQSLAWFSKMWADLYPTSQNTPTNPHFFGEEIFSVRRLLRVPSNELPKMWHWLIFFPIYILLMGPGTWAIVRYLKRPILTWIILPTWIVLGILIIALALSGMFTHTFPLMQEIAYIEAAASGLPARVIQGTAVYAPRAQSLNWTNRGAPRPLAGQYKLNSNDYNYGEPYAVDVSFIADHYAIDIPHSFGVMTWGTEGLHHIPHIHSDLTLAPMSPADPTQDLNINGQLRSEITLRKVNLVMAHGVYNIALTEVLTARQTVDIQAIAQYHGYPYYESYAEPICNLRNLSSISYMGPKPPSNPLDLVLQTSQTCYITAEMEGVPFPSQNRTGNYVAASCVIYTVPCPTQTAGNFNVALRTDSSLVTRGWVDDNGDVNLAYPNTEIIYIVPEFLEIREIDSFSIQFNKTAWGSNPYQPRDNIAKIELWNWQTETWDEQAIPNAGAHLTFTGQESIPYLENLNVARLRITPRNTDGANTNIIINVKAK